MNETTQAAPAAESQKAKKLTAPKKKKKWRKRLVILLILVVVLLVALKACSGKAQQTVSGAYIPAEATRQELAVTVTGTGTIKPHDTFHAATLLKGEILTAPFEEGDHVEKDQVLFTLDPSDVENAITSAESGVKRAKLSLEQAQLNYNELVKTKNDNADDAKIKANADGRVTKLHVKVGDNVTAGTLIAEILDQENMELTVPFHAVTAKGFTVGQAATVTVSGTSTVLSGTIKEIGAADRIAAGGAILRDVVIRVKNPAGLSDRSTATAQVGTAASADIGTFDYAASKQVYAAMSGEIERLDVTEGSYVTDKQVLGKVEEPDMQSQLDNAALNVRSAELSLADAEESLRQAKDNLEDYTITSPISGTVIEKNYKAGDKFDPSTASEALAVIYDLSELSFTMNVSELDVSQLQVGQAVTFTSDALEGKTFRGYVDKININGTTSSGNTNYPVTIVVEDGEGLYPGMNVSATILVEELGNVLTVPSEAIQRGNTVYVAGEGALNGDGQLVDITKLESRQVEIGQADSENIEILSGLEEGETVYIPNQSSNIMQMMGSMMGG